MKTLTNYYRLQASRITKYNRIQAAKGVNPVVSMLFLPFRILFHVWFNLGGNVYRGFGLYDRPLLASYPRSGTNWTRYIIESLSGRPTPGQTRLIEGTNYYIDRAHQAYPVMNRYKKVVLVLRDYRECILRHQKAVWSNYSDVLSLLSDQGIREPASWYIENLKAFDAFEGDKLLIYYEDLIQKPDETIILLAEFIELDRDKTQAFLNSMDNHIKMSVQAYTKKAHSSDTSKSKDLSYHAKTKLTPEQVQDFDNFYFTQYPELAQKYLRRYGTRR